MMILDSNATDCDKPEESFVQFSRAHLEYTAGVHNEVRHFLSPISPNRTGRFGGLKTLSIFRNPQWGL